MTISVSVGTEVVEKIAEREGVDPIELDSQLFDVIDPDALEALTNGTGDRPSRIPPRVEFSYHGYAVTVDETGAVTIDNQPPDVEAEDTSNGAGAD